MLRLYQRILDNMEACQREDVNHVAFLVAYAADPLRLQELQYVMNSLEGARHISTQDLRNTIRRCGLFEIKLNRVHPSHETATAFYRNMSTSTNWHEYLLKTSVLCLCEVSDCMLPLTWDYIDEKLRLLDLGSLEVWGGFGDVTCRKSTMVEIFCLSPQTWCQEKSRVYIILGLYDFFRIRSEGETPVILLDVQLFNVNSIQVFATSL